MTQENYALLCKLSDMIAYGTYHGIILLACLKFLIRGK